MDNVVYGNYTGIYAYGDNSNSVVQNNRSYANTSTGIYLTGYDQTAQGNTVYSDPTGIDSEAYNGGSGFSILNNVIYANANAGLILSSGSDNMVTNNTIYEPAGDGIVVRNSPTQTILTNNIIWVGAGRGISTSRATARSASAATTTSSILRERAWSGSGRGLTGRPWSIGKTRPTPIRKASSSTLSS